MEWPAPLTVGEAAAELPTVACGVRPGLIPRHRLDDYVRRRRGRLAHGNREELPVESLPPKRELRGA